MPRGGGKRSEEERKKANRERMAKKRANPEYREQERLANKEAKRKRRLDPEFQTIENERNATAIQVRRLDPEFRTPEKQRDAEAHQEHRLDTEFRTMENERNATARQVRRLDPEFRTPEKQRDAVAHREHRLDTEFRTMENERNATARQVQRLDPEFRTPEKQRDAVAHKKHRLDAEFRTIENERNATAIQVQRLDPEFRTPEKQRDAIAHREHRLDTEFRAIENERNAIALQVRKLDPEFRTTKQNNNTENHRKKRKLNISNYEHLLTTFEKKINSSPSTVCSCCGGLFYEESTKITSSDKLKTNGCTDEYIKRILYVQQEVHKLCSTCGTSVSKKRIPKLCLDNGFDFPDIPRELKELSPLEERLVALRIPFMQIRLLGTERQSALKGNVVNVENDLDVCAEVIPRQFDDTSTIQVQLMRQMKSKTPYMYETIRPLKIYEAAKYLVNTELYKSENVTLSKDWNLYNKDDRVDFICSRNDIVEKNETDNPDANNAFDNEANQSVATLETEESLGADETLFFIENDKDILGIKIAPGEGKIPTALHMDANAEVLSFPCIYGGKNRNFKEGVKLSYTDIAKSELRRYDRRACQPSKLLYSFKRSFNEKVYQAVQICMRKKVGNITAGDAKNREYVNKMIQKDEGYAIFKHLRSSPSYWKDKTKKVLAMIRQVGKCTFFITLSAAETKWNKLLVMLMKIIKQQDITEEQASQLSFEQKAELIRSDPVTCMRHFDHRFRALLNLLMKSDGGIFSPYKLLEYFGRLEYQMRGSPHVHGLYWIEDAPIYVDGDEKSEKACVDFIDMFITCKRSEEGKMQNLIGYQLHKHSHTCYKKHKDICRFGFPKPPMESTLILTPLPKDYDAKFRKEARELYSKIQENIEIKGRSFKEEIEFDKFIEDFQTTKPAYIEAVRSSIKRPTVFLKRSTNAIFVNAYNQKLLEAWGANIDIQFVLDTYACAKYCVGYILKAEGGVSKLLQAATEDAKRGNKSIQCKLKKFANILINGSEISAQEAAAFLLGIPNTVCSKQVIYINTTHPDDRIGFLKTHDELNDMEDDSQDVYVLGLLHHYAKRPKALENVCLAEFASMYEFSKSKIKKANSNVVENEGQYSKNEYGDDSLMVEVTSGNTTLELLDLSGCLRKRKVRKVIRFRHYGKVEDTVNYHREQLMLFLPWRDETKELISIDTIGKAELYNQEIENNRKPFYWNQHLDDEALDSLINQIEEEDDSVEHNQEVDEYLQLMRADNYFEEDVFSKAGSSSKRVEQFLPPRVVDNQEYIKIMRMLNEKQRRLVLDVLHRLKTSKTPFHVFVSGGAGVGKSHAVNAIVQSYLRYNCKKASEHPDQICVLVSAPTGKAAFNVFGMTLHCTFKLPPNQYGGKLCDLDDGAVNALRMKLSETKLFIIDEISMVSVKQLYEIDQRLKQIFCTNDNFGGKSIIAVGHLRQLPPVAGSYVFMPPKHLPLGECVGNFLWNMFKLFELDEIMRQKGDLEFCKALNNMSEGCMDVKDIELLRSRQITSTNKPPPNSIRLFRTNEECQTYNSEVHATLNTQGAVSIAYDLIDGGTAAEKLRLEEFAKNLSPQQSDGLPYKTHLQVGGEYFVSTNIDVLDGLFNGSTGCLKRIDKNFLPSKGCEIPIRAWMDFRHPLIGIKKRSDARIRLHQQKNGIPFEWVPIDIEQRNLSRCGRYKGLQITRKQIPLVAANGMTIAKAQGSSMPEVVVNVNRFHGRKLTRELLYVACSRSTSLKGLYIDGEFEPPNPPPPMDPVSLEMERLKNNLHQFTIQFLQNYDDNYEKLYFHNVDSFIAHYHDVFSDLCATSSDTLAFVEPKLLITDNINVNNYTCVYRSNCKVGRNSEGALVLGKASNIQSYEYILSDEQCGNDNTPGNYTIVQWKVTNVTTIMVYKSPRYPYSNFLVHLENIIRNCRGKIIVIGDFNINLKPQNKKPERLTLLNLMAKYNLYTTLDIHESSTDHDTHIDCCFSNVAGIQSWYYESYHSIHKPICLVWPKSLV